MHAAKRTCQHLRPRFFQLEISISNLVTQNYWALSKKNEYYSNAATITIFPVSTLNAIKNACMPKLAFNSLLF
jgi:hypothetical protein